MKTKLLFVLTVLLLVVAFFGWRCARSNSDEESYNQAFSLYQLGLEKREMKQSEAAAEYFNEALIAVEKCRNDDDAKPEWLRANILDNLGAMYWKHNLFEEALKCHEEALEKFRLTSDSANMTVAMRNCGRVAASMEDYEAAKKYYEDALLLAKSTNNILLVNDLYLEIGRDYYMMKGDYLNAIKNVVLALQLRQNDTDSKRDSDIDICNMTLGVLYYYTKDYGSAEKHLKAALRSDKAGLKMSCYQTLYVIEYNLGNMQQAIDYQDLFLENMQISDSEHRSENMQRIKADYDLKWQKKEIMYAAKLKSLNSYLIVSIIIIALLIIIIIINRKKAASKLKAEQFKTQMERNQNRIYELVSEMDNLIRKNEELSSDKQTLSQKELMMTNLILQRNKVFATAQALAEQTTASTLNFQLEETDWADFINLTDLIYNGFSHRLLAHFPKLTKWDIRICCLSRQQFSNHVISILLDTQTESYYKRKSRIKQLKMNVIDDERSFEDIIKEI